MDLALCRSHPLLRDLSATELVTLLQHCVVRQLAPGEILLKQGTENHTLYFVLAGQLGVQLHPDDPIDRFVIRAGEIVGEMSIIEQRPAMALVTADQVTTVLAMPEEIFWRDYCSRPALVPGLLELLVRRMRNTDAVLREEFARHIRYEAMQKELESAARIQANLLPTASPLFAHGAFDVHPLFRPARVVGGDFYDALTLGPNRLAVAIGDVSGKGMPAALFMVRVVTLLRMLLVKEADPRTVLPELNRQLCVANDESMFVTLAVLLLDPETGRVIYLNGGHTPALVAPPGEPFEIRDPPGGPLLGVLPSGVFEIRERVLTPGETIVLYTDGITEAENAGHEFFGLARASHALEGMARPRAAELVASLDEAVTAFAGSSPQSDDITVLALTYVGKPDPAAVPHASSMERPDRAAPERI